MMVSNAFAVVTPSHSNDMSHHPHSPPADAADERASLLDKIWRGTALTSSEWTQLGHEKTQWPLQLRSYGNNNDEASSSSSSIMVRLFGMVQNMHETEYVGHDTMCARTPLTIVPLHHVTPWCAASMMMHRHNDTVQYHHCDKKQRLWRRNDDDDDDEMDDHATLSSVNDGNIVAQLYYDYYPQSSSSSPPPLLLNDMVELVGVMEKVTATTDDHVMEEDDNDPVMADSMVPTHHHQRANIVVHVLWYQSVTSPCQLIKPLMEIPMPTSDDPAAAAATLFQNMLAGSAASTHDTAIMLLLWHVLHARAERDPQRHAIISNDQLLGCASLSLQIMTTTDDAASRTTTRLVQWLRHLCPLVTYWPVTLEFLGNSRMAPPNFAASSENNNTAATAAAPPPPRSRLQLPPGTVVIVDTTQLPATWATTSTTTTSAQITAWQALQQLARQHRVPYEFDGGMKLLFEADVVVIALSTPHSACLDGTFRANIMGALLDVELNEHDATIMRRALAYHRHDGSSSHNITMDGTVLEQAQHDFVQRRQLARQSKHRVTLPDEASLHAWLTMTRLVARCRRAPLCTVDDWQQALSLCDVVTQEMS